MKKFVSTLLILATSISTAQEQTNADRAGALLEGLNKWQVDTPFWTGKVVFKVGNELKPVRYVKVKLSCLDVPPEFSATNQFGRFEFSYDLIEKCKKGTVTVVDNEYSGTKELEPLASYKFTIVAEKSVAKSSTNKADSQILNK